MRAAYSGSCRGLGRPEGHGVRAGLGSQVGLRWVVLLPLIYWPNKAGIPHGATSVKQVGGLMSAPQVQAAGDSGFHEPIKNVPTDFMTPPSGQTS